MHTYEGNGYMFTYCDYSDYQILLDLTGPDGWQDNEYFLEKIEQLTDVTSVTIASKEKNLEKLPDTFLVRPNLIENIGMIVYDDLDTDETGVLIVSNNTDHVEAFVDMGFSTVYLQTENCQLDLNHKMMPDEIWSYRDFFRYVDNPDLRFTYASETIGFPDAYELMPKFITFDNMLEIPNIDYTADVVFTGRYFPTKDNRHYIHPLSRAIIGF